MIVFLLGIWLRQILFHHDGEETNSKIPTRNRDPVFVTSRQNWCHPRFLYYKIMQVNCHAHASDVFPPVLDGPQNRSKREGEEKIPCSLSDRAIIIQPLYSHFTNWTLLAYAAWNWSLYNSAFIVNSRVLSPQLHVHLQRAVPNAIQINGRIGVNLYGHQQTNKTTELTLTFCELNSRYSTIIIQLL
jgi:hypothetical protein